MMYACVSGSRLGFVLALSLLFTQPVRTVAQQDFKRNPEVVYFVMGTQEGTRKESVAKGLSDFQCFGMYQPPSNRGKSNLEGYIMTDRNDPEGSSLNMKSVRLQGKNLSFKTESRKGVAFTFEGRFLRSGDFEKLLGKPVPVIEGVVRKFRQGKKVAEAKLRFSCGRGN